MLYFSALVDGLDALPQADARVRAEIDADGGAARLARAACRAGARSIRRRRSASRRTIPSASSARSRSGSSPASRCRRCRACARAELPFELKGIALLPDRALLHQRIAQRFDAMLRMGWSTR